MVVPITLITLLVGGIVVMKHHAALQTMQFLIESGLLCALGGVIGLLLSWGVCLLITTLAGITMTITIGYILLALIVSTVIGMLAGIYPAFKGARLDPIVALTNAT